MPDKRNYWQKFMHIPRWCLCWKQTKNSHLLFPLFIHSLNTFTTFTPNAYVVVFLNKIHSSCAVIPATEHSMITSLRDKPTLCVFGLIAFRTDPVFYYTSFLSILHVYRFHSYAFPITVHS